MNKILQQKLHLSLLIQKLQGKNSLKRNVVKMKLKFIIAFVWIFLLCTASIESVFAQTGVSLAAEIQNMERTVSRQGITPNERHEALVRLAQLRQLSGDIEGAARNWLEAAGAIPGRVDDEALLNCAYCLAAMGEWDRAATALEPLLSKSARARFLNFSVRAIKTGDTSSLAAIIDIPEYSEMKSEIIFTLWKISRGSSADRWRQRLVAEFPQTPEGRLAAGESSTIIVRPNPFWLFANGLDSLPLLASETVGRPSQSAQTAAVTAPQVTAPQPTAAQPVASAARLQTGIFSRQANAQTQASSLRNAGFSPAVERRVVNNNEMWAVTVPVGSSQTQTMNALRTAGFDSFLIR
jgi:hypothetical protein